ncbi:MAG: X2-like carbohydrate binding domain-containing protein [Dehalococcoidia bacterium]
MKGKSRAITQVCLALLLSLSLGLMTAPPSQVQGQSGIISLSPAKAEYDLGCPSDVRTTVLYRIPVEIASIYDDEALLDEGYYTVRVVEPGRSYALTILDSYLADRLNTEGESVVLNVVFDEDSVRRFTIMAVQYPAVDPQEAVYKVDDPPHFLETHIIWGCATGINSIIDDHNYRLIREQDYRVLGNRLLIFREYLSNNLESPDDEVRLFIRFDGDGEASFVVKGILFYPEVSSPSNPAPFNLLDPADVRITITLYDATTVVAFITGNATRLEPGDDYRVEYENGKAILTVLASYLGSRLQEPDETIELSITFGLSDGRRFTIPSPFLIVAKGETASIDPKTAEYDIDDPDDVGFTITWGDAVEDVLVSADGEALNGKVSGGDNNDEAEYDYVLGETVNGKAPLTILESYLSGRLKRPDDSIDVTLVFDFEEPPDLRQEVTLVITATATRATIAPEWVPYAPTYPSDVSTIITWRAASEVFSVSDDGEALVGRVPGGDNGEEEEHDYVVGETADGRATLTILNNYLAGRLQSSGESVDLEITFNEGREATLSITAVEPPSLRPPDTAYDLENPGHVETTLEWQAPTRLDSITQDGRLLTPEVDYEVDDTTQGEAILRILKGYLGSRLERPGDDIVLDITFNVGRNATLKIRAVQSPRVDPAEVNYDLACRGDVISTDITWGGASGIDAITDEHGYPLELEQDYLLLGDTLFILDRYLAEIVNDKKLERERDTVVLTILFDDGSTVDFTIKALGAAPRVSPLKANFDLSNPADVHTTITFNIATAVIRIEDGGRPLYEGGNYTLQPIEPGMSSNLTVLSTYLEDRLDGFMDAVTLTIVFDVGSDCTFTIETASVCFIATTAYGTPMADEVQVLRNLRDGYLLTNPPGRAFVDFYYRISPPIARFIAEHPGVKPIVRAGLVPAVAVSTMVVDTGPRQDRLIPGLVLLASVLVAVWANRKRKRNTGYA